MDQMLEKSLADAAAKMPYYSRGFAALTPVLREGLGTCSVDTSWRLYYDPVFLSLKSRTERSAIMCHELEHLLRDHAGRRDGREPRAWNVAADAEINDDIADLPADGIFPKTLGMPENLTAEEYYASVSVTSASASAICGRCGSGAGGEQLPGELDATEAPGVSSPEDAARLREAIASDVVAAAARGAVPGSVRLWAKARLKKIENPPDWAARVAAHIGATEGDPTWARLPRRQPPTGIMRSGKSRVQKKIGIVIDVSGSMSGHGDAISSVLARIVPRCETWIYSHDCADSAQRPILARSWRDVLRLSGGGGTDLRPAITRACREQQRVFVLTDGDTPWPEPMPLNSLALILRADGTWEAK